MKHSSSFVLALTALVASTCGAEQIPIVREFDFNAEVTDWLAGSSDFNSTTKPTNVLFEPRMLPAPFDGHGLYAAGTNRSDDLFLYIKKPFSGLVPGKSYVFLFKVTFLTDAPASCAGSGGGPGTAVTMKAGASQIEPLTVQTGDSYQMNIDKGNQSSGGKDALVLGNIANSSTNCIPRIFETKTLTSGRSVRAEADTNGEVWIIFGTDSGHEAGTAIYYQSAQVIAFVGDK